MLMLLLNGQDDVADVYTVLYMLTNSIPIFGTMSRTHRNLDSLVSLRHFFFLYFLVLPVFYFLFKTIVLTIS